MYWPLDLRGNAKVHTESKAKYVFLAFYHCSMPPSRHFYVSNRAIHETFEERDWGKPLRPKRWMKDMDDILICVAEQNGWPTPTPLPYMLERFPLPGKEGTKNKEENDDDNEEETPIVPPNYE
ncbi:hypothetical protein PVK06_035686 [Gossypium arboreum]|uniref:Uncharacterized protein n=1 Tax=Gossypium arboreum TaxID=29729 RepID=A0ABR0NHI2_GOSAR|nr:hypothetical protein PVK06_035686 [Gossypium arboreum]